MVYARPLGLWLLVQQLCSNKELVTHMFVGRQSLTKSRKVRDLPQKIRQILPILQFLTNLNHLVFLQEIGLHPFDSVLPQQRVNLMADDQFKPLECPGRCWLLRWPVLLQAPRTSAPVEGDSLGSASRMNGASCVCSSLCRRMNISRTQYAWAPWAVTLPPNSALRQLAGSRRATWFLCWSRWTWILTYFHVSAFLIQPQLLLAHRATVGLSFRWTPA